MERALPKLHVDCVGTGPPLVLLHGWALHGGLFTPLLPALSRRHRVHAVDLPGHGRSDPLRPWTLQAAVEALQRTFIEIGEPLAVLGWSLGGMIALRWALDAPGEIAKLVLVAATPKFVADATWPHAMSADTLKRFADELRVAYRLTLQRFLSLQVQGSESGRATLATLRHELFARGEPDAAVLSEALAAFAGIDLRRDVARVASRTLVIAGERDTLVPPAASEWVASALPAARFVRMTGAAHAPFLSHPEAFLEALGPFLGDG